MGSVIIKKKQSKWHTLSVVMLGGAVGFINGLLGGGGGSLVVPIYQSMLGIPAKQAHSNAVATILPLCFLSGVVYMLRGGADLSSLAFVSLGVVAGGVIGAYLLKRLSNNLLTFVFYIIMLYAGIRSVTG